MKNLTKILALSFSLLLFFSCNSDDEGLTTEQKAALLNGNKWVIDTSYAPSSLSSKTVGQSACAAKNYLTFDAEIGEGGIISGQIYHYEYYGSDINKCGSENYTECFTYNPTTNIFSDNECSNEVSSSSIKSNVAIEEDKTLTITNDYIILDGDKYTKTEKPTET